MNISELLAEARQQGVELWAEGGASLNYARVAGFTARALCRNLLYWKFGSKSPTRLDQRRYGSDVDL